MQMLQPVHLVVVIALRYRRLLPYDDASAPAADTMLL
jgi:hypothetical protein